MNNINNKKKIISMSNEKKDDNIEIFKNKIKKHQTRLFIVGVTTIAASIGVFFYKNNETHSEKEAQTEMIQAVRLFENENFLEAINGNTSTIGLIEVVKKYSKTKAANLANFYIGISYLNLGEYNNCIESLKKVSFNDYIMQARAFSLIADAYSEQEDYKNAIYFYEKAANTKPNKTASPTYLEKAAIAYELNEDKDGALKCYETILEKYPNYESSTVIKNIERLTPAPMVG